MHNYIFSLYPDTKAIFQVKKIMQCRFSEMSLPLTADNLLPVSRSTFENSWQVFITGFVLLNWLWGSQHPICSNKSVNTVSKVSTNYLTPFHCI